MSLLLTDEQKMIRDLAKNFATKKVAPLAAEMDLTGEIHPDLIQELADVGFLGINIPEAYGGTGMDNIAKCLMIMEIAKVCASTAELIAVHTLTNEIILKNGTEEQKKKYLPKAASGAVGAFALTEADAGSDAASARTKAIAKGNDYIINGSKCFISNMGPNEGDYVILIALTEPSLKTKGLSAIIVDRDTPGFSVGKTEDKMGIRSAAVSELIFNDCCVPRTVVVKLFCNTKG